jgi:hypothetical protein
VPLAVVVGEEVGALHVGIGWVLAKQKGAILVVLGNPGKQYRVNDSIDSPTDPLPPGRYEMTLKLPVEVEPPAWPVIDLAVAR